MQDTAGHSSKQLANVEVRHTLSVHDVGAALVAAGVPRSHRQVIRYCETAMLDAVKVPGPTGAQWFVSPVSLPKAIGDLKQWESQRARQSSPQLANVEVRHTLSVHDVGAALVAAGVPRSHRQVIRYCETAMLDAVKVPGLTGAQ